MAEKPAVPLSEEERFTVIMRELGELKFMVKKLVEREAATGKGSEPSQVDCPRGCGVAVYKQTSHKPPYKTYYTNTPDRRDFHNCGSR